jgi:hypothetical protein
MPILKTLANNLKTGDMILAFGAVTAFPGYEYLLVERKNIDHRYKELVIAGGNNSIYYTKYCSELTASKYLDDYCKKYLDNFMIK